MQIITDFKQVEHLVLPTPVLTMVYHHLLEPFEGYPEVADQFWSDTGTQLLLLTNEDSDLSLKEQPFISDQVLHHLQHTPEYVYQIGKGEQAYLFALSVLDDEGRGCYFLSPIQSPTTLVKHLITQAQPFETTCL